MRSAEVAGFARAVAAELAARHGLPQLAPLGAPRGGRAREGGGGGGEGPRVRARTIARRGRAAPARGGPRARGGAQRRARQRGEDRALPPEPARRPRRGPGAARRAREGARRGPGGHARRHRLEPAPHRAGRPRPAPRLPQGAALDRARPARRRDGSRGRAAGRGEPSRWRRGAICARATGPPPSSSRSSPRSTRRSRRWSCSPPSSTRGRAAGGGSSATAGARARASARRRPRPSARAPRRTRPTRTGRSSPIRSTAAGTSGSPPGSIAGSAAPPETPKVDLVKVAQAVRALPPPAAGPSGGLEANFVPDYKVHDGRHLENAWLAELPHPITKLTWDAAALLSPATAKRLGLESGDVAALTLSGRSVQAPVLVVPGHADDAVTLPLGYGQGVPGEVGRGGVQFDAYALRTSEAPWIAAGLAVRAAGRKRGPRRHPGPLHDGRSGHRARDGRRRAAACAGGARHAPRSAGDHPEAGGLLEAGLPLGHGDRPLALHRVRRVHPRLPGGEQHPGRREGGRPPQPRDALAPGGPVLHRHRRGSRSRSRSRSPASTARRRPASTSAR